MRIAPCAPKSAEAKFSRFVTILSSHSDTQTYDDLPDTDFTQRFIFDDSDTRGEMVALERSYAEVLAKHPIRSRSRNCSAS
jgi:hypothetical protein